MRVAQRISVIGLLAVAVLALQAKADYRDDSRVLRVSGGEDHSLVLTADSGIWACGPNGGYDYEAYESYFGVLGTASNDPDLEQKALVRVRGPNDVNYIDDITEVDAGWKHSLALDMTGFVWSWGWNTWGQLGRNNVLESPFPVQVLRGAQPDDPCQPSDYLKHIIGISAGRSGEHSLAVDVNNFVYAWGRNQEGQCGNGESDTGYKELVPVYVWRGEQPQDPNDPCDLLTRILAVSAGERHSMALERYEPCDPNMDGRVYTWGDDDFVVNNGSGVLGVGAADDTNTPVCVHRGEQDYNEPNQIYLKHIVAISAGWDHSMALEAYDPYDPNLDGRVYTWGNNGQGWAGWFGERSEGGRLGDGSTDSNDTPVLVLSGEQYPPDPNSPLKHIIAISAGEGHSMALDADGYVYTWGDNQYGQLGNDTNVPSTTPVRVLNPQDPNLPLSSIVAISAGYWHSLAIDSNGVVWVWGKTKDGRLGLADMAYADPCVCAVPHRIPVVYDYNDGGVGKGFAFSIEDAINDANEGDVVEASWGIYYENVTFGDESITLKSEHPEDPEVVADTIVDARYNAGGGVNDYYCAVDFNNSSGSTLAGLTLRNATGGGVLCENVDSVTIMSCLIRDNARHGIWLNASSVDIQNCDISGNASDETSDYHGVYCISGSDVNIVNCVVADNDGNGINCNQSSAAIIASAIQDNDDYGVEAIGDRDMTIQRSLIEGNRRSGVYAHAGCDFLLTGSVICDNGWDGVDLEYNNPETLTNNWIYNNGRTHPSYQDGVWFMNSQPSAPVVRNNTIFGNPKYGIKVYSQQTDPNILNCIIYGNEVGDLDGGTFSTVNYSCLQDPRGTNNITSAPCFVDEDFNNFHLGGGSPCIDTGDPYFEPEPDETDIDGEYRIINERVDMGADEFCRATDFNGDGLVNFVDYSMLARHWKQEDTDAGYSDAFDLWDDDVIDFNDVMVLCEDWLVTAECRTESMLLMAGRGGAGMVGGLGLDDGLSAVASAEREPAVAEPVDIEAIMKWLAEIWLDPEVREQIDAEDWLKLYESLKDLEPITK